MAALTDLLDNLPTSVIVIPAERAGPKRVEDARKRAYRPASEEPEPSIHRPSMIPPAGDYWVPALHSRGHSASKTRVNALKAALAWPG